MTGELLNIATRLVLGTASAAPAVVIDNPNGEGLRVEWEVTKTNTSSPDTAHIIIYNLAKVHRKELSALLVQGRLTIDLYVGWGSLPEPLFRGEDWRIVPERKSGTDVLTEIEAGIGLEPETSPPQGGSEYGMGFGIVITKIVSDLGWLMRPSTLSRIETAGAALNVPTFQSVKDFPLRQQLDLLLATIRLSWSVEEGGNFVVYAGGLRDDVPPLVLDPLSGLLTWAELDVGGVEFTALAQSRTVPGQQITIADELGVLVGGGPLRVERVIFSGTSEGPSVMRGTARKLQVS